MKRGEAAIDEIELINSIKQGELTAWSDIINRYQRPIYYFTAKLLKNHHQAADITQQVFIMAYKKIDQLKRPEQFKPWLYKIALNFCNSYFQRIRRYVFVDVAETNLKTEDSLLDDIIDRETRSRLKQAVGKLPKRQRLTVMLRVYQGLNYNDIAIILGCSPDAAKANYHHALNKLKCAMTNEV
jgi:RNA polymerase sigma factor (sigma-70 family)